MCVLYICVSMWAGIGISACENVYGYACVSVSCEFSECIVHLSVCEGLYV